MHLILYTVKDVLLMEKTYPKRYLCVMYSMSLKAARFQHTAYFFTPLTHPQLLHKMETRPCTVVEYFYEKNAMHSINLSDLK